MSIKKEHYINAKIRKVKINHGKFEVEVISVPKSQLATNHKGMVNIAIANKKDGGRFMFDFNQYIVDSKKEQLEEIIENIDETQHDALLSEEELNLKYNK